jgi:hypothetical protein
MISAKDIAADLRVLGLGEGMNLVVHSALSSLGTVEGGADAVIDALLEVLGKSGTLAMPAFFFPPSELFDPAVTPSRMGLITETFRKRSGVLRSFHPTHSVAAFGLLARYLVEGHKTATAFGIDSPLHRLAKSEGYVLLLGVQHRLDDSYRRSGCACALSKDRILESFRSRYAGAAAGWEYRAIPAQGKSRLQPEFQRSGCSFKRPRLRQRGESRSG